MRHWLRTLAACLALGLALALPAAAQTTDAPPTLSDAELLAQLRAGGLVVYFRHTATDFSRDDRAMRDYDDCAHQRALSAKGRADARAIGEQWKRLRLPVGRVLASPYCRTRDVAQRMFGRYERSPEVRGGPADAGAERYAGLRHLLSTPVTDRANLIISSHGNPYHAVAGPPYLTEGEAAVVRPLGDGRWQVLARLQGTDWARLK